MELNLNGLWRVTSLPHNQPMDEILRHTFVPEGWLEARIPEEIHSTLRRAGVIRGNTYGKDAQEEAWIEELDWVYFREFYAPQELCKQQVHLEFQGIDTFCRVYLNGREIGSHDNMFVPLELDVTNHLRYGERNVLLVRIFSATSSVRHMDDSAIFSITDSDRIFARKAQMNYGWDFCGRCVTAGIWKPVRLIGEEEGKITSYYLRTVELSQDSALIHLDVEASLAENPQDYEIRLTLKDGAETVLSQSNSISQAEHLELTLPQPRLWWPRPYGEPFLYEFTLALFRKGDCLQTCSQPFGVRTIRVLQEPQEDGRSFQFMVNGKKLFIRGANWVPINTVYTHITLADYENYLDYAAEGNLSMLRIWGGGIYEPLEFFHLCAQRGILIWSDFMLACGIYPQDENFLEKMGREGEYVIKTYRNSTALAIWAGDNENGQAYGWAGRPYEFRRDNITRVVLKELLERLDPCRFYLPTSPDSPDENYIGGDNPASPYQGDTHLYIMSANPGARGGRDYGKNYYKRILSYRPRFISEFGFISFPGKDSFHRFNFRRDEIVAREELSEFLPYAAQDLALGKVDETIYSTQMYHALALKYWIEYFRTLKGICSGCLYWKLNDPLADRPVIGIFPSHMSTVDMYGNTKIAYYYTRRAYEDVMIAFRETPEGWTVYACNELEAAFTGTLTLTHFDFSGKIISRRELSCTIPADAATPLASFSKEDFTPEDIYSHYLKAEFIGDTLSLENRFFFADIHERNRLALLPGELTVVSTRRRGPEFHLTVKAKRFIPNLRLHILDLRAHYSDNCFPMDAGQERKLTITVKEGQDFSSAALFLEGENIPRQVIPLASFR